MRTIYINYTDSITKPNYRKLSGFLKASKKTKYHGGGKYTNMILQKMQENHGDDGYNFILLWPKDHQPQTELEKSLYNDGFYTIQEIESLSEETRLVEGSTLFLPLLHNPADYNELKRIKDANPTVKIVATIHDLRSSFNNYGLSTRYYFTGLKYHLFFLQRPAFWFLNTLYFNRKIKKGVKLLDKIITVSNYSLQQIIRYPVKGRIIPQYQINSLEPGISKTPREPKENYFLFVSGSRPVKNFLRTLEAFCVFKETDSNGYFLYATGVDESLLSNLMRYGKLNKEIVQKWVKVMGYVDEETLDSLYRNCNALLYTSLHEGFGLPLLEAARQGRPAISSYLSSIPEVLGCCSHYVNPYDVQSMAKGMKYMSQEHILEQYEKRIYERYPLLEQRWLLDSNVVLEYILED